MYKASLKFGDSYLYHDNKFVAFVMYSFIEFTIVSIENAVYFVGPYIDTELLGPVISYMTNDFYMYFPVI